MNNGDNIENLLEIIKLAEPEMKDNDENVSAILDIKDLKSLRNLLTRLKDYEQIEKEHQKENGELREQVDNLEKDNRHYQTMILRDYISKFVIREKIEELDKERTYELTKIEGMNEYREFAMNILQDLLEENK